MKPITRVEFRYRSVESQLTCPNCETVIAAMTRSVDAELFSTDTGLALKILVPFNGTFVETGGKLLCYRCRQKVLADKKNHPTDLIKELESLEAKFKEKFENSTGDDESRWHQAQEILRTLHHLVEGP